MHASLLEYMIVALVLTRFYVADFSLSTHINDVVHRIYVKATWRKVRLYYLIQSAALIER